MKNQLEIITKGLNKRKDRSKLILDKLLRNEYVSRWDVLNHRVLIRTKILENSEYQDLHEEVESMIESAKESLL